MEISVDAGRKAALEHKVIWFGLRLREVWTGRRRTAAGIEDPRERRAALAALRAARQAQRDAGLWWDSQAAVIGWYLRHDLEARGWLHQHWPPIPRDEHRLPGRRIGVAHHPPGSGGGRLTVRLPGPLSTTLHRACWHTSAPAVAAVQDWQATHPWPYDDQEQTDLDALRASITTSGDVLRQVLADAVADWHPYVGDRIAAPPVLSSAIEALDIALDHQK